MSMTTAAPVVSDVARQYLHLHLAEAIGPVLAGRLVQHFGSLTAVLSASPTELGAVPGIGPRRAGALRDQRVADAVGREIDRAQEGGVRIICWEDADYPPLLRHCPDPPICLYLRGQMTPADAVAMAVVGSRRCSHYGAEQARRFAGLLGNAGFTIVSGLARGVDGHAHRGALTAQGRTVAVLGSGVDVIYPREHDRLADEIIAHGALVSDAPLGSGPSADAFPRRNRIIVGLSLGVLVVEAARRSGALISARLGQEYNREVFAVPGRLDATTAAGTNALIRDGQAKLVTDLEDILDELGDVGRIMGTAAPADPTAPAAPGMSLGEDEQQVWAQLGDDAVHVDDLSATCALPIERIAASLTALRLKGLVSALPGARFVRRTG